MPVSRERLRWTAILCCHALASIAFYRAGFKDGVFVRTEEFWKRLNGNFLDIAVLEWSKLFAEPRGAHGWRKVLADPAGFEAALLQDLNISAAEFESYCVGMRTYRDKFVAHLDENAKAKYPELDLAIESTKFLLQYLHDWPAAGSVDTTLS